MTDQSNDIVDTVATENTDVDSQEIKEWQSEETQTEQPEANTEGKPEKSEPELKTEPEKKKSRAQERIEQLARENAELKRQYAESQAKSKAEETKRPHLDDYDTYDEFEDAMEEYREIRAEQRFAEKMSTQEAEKTASQQEIEMQSAMDDLSDQGIDLKAYLQKANEMPALPITLDQFGLSAKDTLMLAKDLIDDEATYLAISKLNPTQAAIKIGQIIESKKTKTTTPVSKAPPPLNTVTGNASTTRDPSKMSDEEWYREQTKQRTKR